MEEIERHPVCPHTQHASRKKELAFRTEIQRMFPKRFTRSELLRLSGAGVRIFTDIEQRDMPLKRIPDNPNYGGGSPAIVAAPSPDPHRRR